MAKPKSEESESTVAEKVVPKSQLILLINEGISVASKNAENSGKHGERVASAVENAGLDRKAFAIAKGAVKLGKNKGADAAIKMMRNAMLYFEMAVEGKLIGDIHVAELFPDRKPEAETVKTAVDAAPADPDKEAAEANTKALQKGIKKKADATTAPPPPPPAASDDEDENIPAHLRRSFQPPATAH